MTIGELRAAIAELDDALDVTVAFATEDEDGDELRYLGAAESIAQRTDPDTATDSAVIEARDFSLG